MNWVELETELDFWDFWADRPLMSGVHLLVIISGEFERRNHRDQVFEYIESMRKSPGGMRLLEVYASGVPNVVKCEKHILFNSQLMNLPAREPVWQILMTYVWSY